MTRPIVRERRVNAPASKVYAFLTESDGWARWQGLSARLEASPGGAFEVNMPNGQMARGAFVRMIPDRLVEFTWGWEGHAGLPPGSSTVVIELVPDGETTLVRLTHAGLPEEEIDLHEAGWDRYLPRLGAVAEGGEPGPDGPDP